MAYPRTRAGKPDTDALSRSGLVVDVGCFVGALDVDRCAHRVLGLERYAQGAADHRQ